MNPGSRLAATCWSHGIPGLLEQVAKSHARLGAAHLVEARLDLLHRPPERSDVEGLVRAAGGRLIVTCRPGGSGAPAGSADRRALLDAALEAGAFAADVEAGGDPPRTAGARVIASWHAPDVDERYMKIADAERLVADLGVARPWAIKLALPAGSVAETLEWVDAGARAVPEGVEWAPVALGPAGSWLRELAARAGVGGRPLSALAYVAAAEPLPGPNLGQVTLEEALARGVDRVGPATRVHAVFGWPLEATWSPHLHSRLFAARGMDAILAALPVRDVGELRRAWDRLGLVGAAVTAPHKVAARGVASAESPAVRRSGALNTLRVGPSGLEAEGFDGAAARDALAAHVSLKGRHVVVLGAGGAARALIPDLVDAGCTVTVLARDPDAARRVAAAAGARCGAELYNLSHLEADVLVNATPVGADPASDALPVPAEDVRAPVVLDLVTTPPETALLRLARSRGLTVVDGLAVLARQAAAQQRWWAEREPDGAEPPSSDAEVESLLRRVVTGEASRAGGDRGPR